MNGEIVIWLVLVAVKFLILYLIVRSAVDNAMARYKVKGELLFDRVRRACDEG